FGAPGGVARGSRRRLPFVVGRGFGFAPSWDRRGRGPGREDDRASGRFERLLVRLALHAAASHAAVLPFERREALAAEAVTTREGAVAAPELDLAHTRGLGRRLAPVDPQVLGGERERRQPAFGRCEDRELALSDAAHTRELE